MPRHRPGVRIDPDRLLPWLCLVAVVARLAAIAIKFPPGDGDPLWQRWLGERILHEHAIPRSLGPETFAASGAPWIPQEWLFSVSLALGIDRGVPWLVPLVCALAVAAALACVILRSERRGVSPALSSVAVLICGLAMIQSFGVRVQVFSWTGVAIVLWLLEMEGPWEWLVLPVTLVWANLHASVFLVPAIVLIFAAAAALRDRTWSRDVSRYLAIAASCAAATLATPLGLDLPRYALGLMMSPIRHLIGEWEATSLDSVAFALGAFPLVLALVAFGVRASLRDRLLVLGFTMLLFTALRNVPVFAVATAPIALAALPLGRGRRSEPTTVERAAAWTTVAAASLAAVTISTLSWRGAPSAAQTLPVGPAQTLLAQAQTTPRVFCEDFAWCSLFLAEPRPARFFMDGRCDPYPPKLWREYVSVLNGNTGSRHVLDEYHVDAVLVRLDSPLDRLLAERPNVWRLIATDGHSRMYVRPALVAKPLPRLRETIASKRTAT